MGATRALVTIRCPSGTTTYINDLELAERHLAGLRGDHLELAEHELAGSRDLQPVFVDPSVAGRTQDVAAELALQYNVAKAFGVPCPSGSVAYRRLRSVAPDSALLARRITRRSGKSKHDFTDVMSDGIGDFSTTASDGPPTVDAVESKLVKHKVTGQRGVKEDSSRLQDDPPCTKADVATQCNHYDIFKPVVAALSGAAVGGGLEVAIMADMVVMADDTYIADLHAKINVGGMDSMNTFLPPMIARELTMTDRRLTAEECYRWGFANYVVPKDQVLDKAIEVAEASARTPALIFDGMGARVRAGFRSATHVLPAARHVQVGAGRP